MSQMKTTGMSSWKKGLWSDPWDFFTPIYKPLYNLVGGNSNVFYVQPFLGKMNHFDEHIFQLGWFNHQLDK